ncbi:MAG: hypothetical protein HA496_01985 [Thaumarchaeota archaeon]|jgi:hypothetical protein|nr:hypothetical protein [Nitrososphaerota archaeon]
MEGEKTKKVVLDIFPTGICGCGQRDAENAPLFKLASDVLRDFKDKVEVNIMEYGTEIDKAFLRLNQILENSGKGRIVSMGLGAQVFRSIIPMIAINGKIAFAASVPSKEALYVKINEALKESS